MGLLRNRSDRRQCARMPVAVRKIAPLLHPAAMDLRLLLVLAPIVLAASWAVFHIGRAAVGQLQLFIKRAA